VRVDWDLDKTHGVSTAERVDVEEGKGPLTLEELERRDLSCAWCQREWLNGSTKLSCDVAHWDLPLMILQKMQEARLWVILAVWVGQWESWIV
jgi:hypothetical protein